MDHKVTAEQADQYCREIREKARESHAYQMLYDEHLATSYFHWRLWGRTFMDDGPQQRAELESMRRNPPAPSDAFDIERFRRNYVALIDQRLTGLPQAN